MDPRMRRDVQQIEKHYVATPCPVKADGGGNSLPLLGDLDGSSQHHPSKRDRDQSELCLLLLESPGNTGDPLPKD